MMALTPRRVLGLAGRIAIVAVAVMFSARPADPGAADPPGGAAATAELRRRAVAAAGALDLLAAELDGALRHARQAAGMVARGGPADPSDSLEAAAAGIEASAEAALRARSLVEAVGGHACAPTGNRLRLRIGRAELDAAARRLREAGPGADAVAAVRAASTATVVELSAAAGALDAGDATAASEAHRRAERALLDTAAAYEPIRPLMPTAGIWFETTERLVDALGALIEATRRGDRRDIQAAADDYAAAGEEAALADRALAVALADASASVLGPAVGEAAALKREVDELTEQVRVITEASGCR